MKKFFRVFMAVMFTFVISLSIVLQNVQAYYIETASGIAGGSWSNGTIVDVSNMMDSKPVWLQLLSTDGVKLTKAGQICHPFRGGQFGWIGEIREFKDGKWVKLLTTTSWVPDEEGTMYACATAPEAGTYALFGYYNGPREISAPVTSVCTLSMDGWIAETIYPTLYLFIDNLDEGTMIHFKQTTTDPNVTLATTEGDVPVKVAKYRVAELTTISQTGTWSVNIEVSVQGCSKTFTFENTPD